MRNDYSKKLDNAITNGNYSLALSLYADWYKAFDSRAEVLNQWSFTHRQNAASLARKHFYDELKASAEGLPRCERALANFVGLSKEPFQHPMQKPNFLYVPDVPAKPFYLPEEIPGIESIIEQTEILRELYAAKGFNSSGSYVEHLGTVPDSKEWQILKASWQSLHLVTAGEMTEAMQQLPEAFQNAFQNECVPNCPPFSPEVFVSTLKPGAYIPPHYGISNVKLTAHIPIRVTPKAWLKAGDSVFNWNEDSAMIFDDSFLHSAKNEHEDERVVLIFDVWHPDLSPLEKAFFQQFMALHGKWAPTFGVLANLDK